MFSVYHPLTKADIELMAELDKKSNSADSN
jgi:hypothetical protein